LAPAFIVTRCQSLSRYRIASTSGSQRLFDLPLMAGKKTEIDLVAGLEASFFNRHLRFAGQEPRSTASSRTCSPIRQEPTSFGSIASSADGKSTPRCMGKGHDLFQQGLLKQDAAAPEADAKIHISLEALVQSDNVVDSFGGPCMQLEESVGSQGHPDSCRPACKYVRRKGGCRDGANCPNCHFCEWRRATRMKEQSAEPALFSAAKRMPPPGMCMLSVANGSPSVGSVGHPHSCAAPCKYFFKSSGCKDGGACTRCHICTWSRKQERKKVEDSQMPSAIAHEIMDAVQSSNLLQVSGSRFTSHSCPSSLKVNVGDAPMYISVTDPRVGQPVQSF